MIQIVTTTITAAQDINSGNNVNLAQTDLKSLHWQGFVAATCWLIIHTSYFTAIGQHECMCFNCGHKLSTTFYNVTYDL